MKLPLSVTTRAAAAALVIVCSLCPAICAAAPTDETFAFDLPPGPLGGTLIDIATRAGVVISFAPALVEHRRAAALRGQFTLRLAFARVLEGSGLAAEITPQGEVKLLTATAAPASAPSAAPELPEPPPRTALALEPVLVLGTQEPPVEQGLRGLRGSSATRSDTPLVELSQAVSVVTPEALAMHGPMSTSSDALRLVTGVTAQVGGNAGQAMTPLLLVRGLPALYAMSGMRTLRGWLPIDNALIERIEVPKGPSGVIGGVAEFGGRGGGVNTVLRSADRLPRAEATHAVASADGSSLHTSVDLGGAAGGTAWRLAGVASDSATTDGGYKPQRGAGLVAALGHRDGALEAELSTLVDHRRIAPAPAARARAGTGDSSLSRLEDGQMPTVDASDRLLWRYAGIDLDVGWKISPQWRMAWKGRVETLASDAQHHRYWLTDRETAGVTLLRQNTSGRRSGLQWSLSGKVKTGEALHGLLLAYDIDRSRTFFDSVGATWRLDPTRFEPGVTPLPAAADSGDPNVTIRRETHERKHAVLLQDQLSLGAWRLRLALQRVRTPEVYDDRPLQGPRAMNRDLGVLYQFAPTLSVYAGHQFSQEIDGRTMDFALFDGRVAPSRRLRQTQAGVKLDWPQQRVALTVEGFALRQLDTLQQSSQLPGSGVYALPGRRVDGLEAELAGRPAQRLDLLVGFTLLRARDTAPAPDTAVPQGVEVPATGTAARSLQLMARYALTTGGEPAHSLGVVFRAHSKRWAVAPDVFGSARGLQLPGGARLDLSWTRTTGPWSFGVAVQNLADRRLYGAQAAPDFIPLEPGRQVALSLRYAD